MSDLTWNGDFWEAYIYISIFSESLTQVYIYRDDCSAPTQRQLSVFNKLSLLPESIVYDIEKNAVSYFEKVDSEMSNNSQRSEIDKNRIWANLKIKRILIPELYECNDDFFIISAECDWEPEHGMELLVKNCSVISCNENRGIAFNPQWEDVVKASETDRQKFLELLLAD